MNDKDYLDTNLFGSKWCDYAAQWKALGELYEQRGFCSMLNIGLGNSLEASKWSSLLVKMFGLQFVENLELSPQVCRKARESQSAYVHNVQEGDVRAVKDIYGGRSFDIVFWSHGPEHIERSAWAATFSGLEGIGRFVILQCPWGNGYDDDPNHVAKNIVEGEFEAFGYTATYNGKRNTRNAGILAWKELG